MRILLISYYYPPIATSGSLRVGMTAKYLQRAGHKVQVLTAADLPYPGGATDPEVPLTAVPCLQVNSLPKILLGRGKAGVAQFDSGPTAAQSKDSPKFLQSAMQGYRWLTNLPDEAIGWYRPALKAGRKLIQSFGPDVIFATAPAYTGLLVGRTLAIETGLPLVSEFRDPWLDNYNRKGHPLRHMIDHCGEKRVLARSDSVLSVSQPLVDALKKRIPHDVSAVVYSHGYDPDKYAHKRGCPQPLQEPGLHIVYTGLLYPPHDPLDFLTTLHRFHQSGHKVTLHLLGRFHGNMMERARETGTEQLIRRHGHSSHNEVVGWQQHADLLLLFLWPYPEQDSGLYSGKIFEYVGAGRPILALGNRGQDVAADLVTGGKFGTVVRPGDELLAQLILFAEQKDASGSIAAPPEEARNSFACSSLIPALEKSFDQAIKRRQKLAIPVH